MKTERLTIHKIIRRLVSGWSCRKDWRLCILTGVVILLSKLLIACFKPHSCGAAGSFLSWNFVKNGLLCNWCRFLVRCIEGSPITRVDIDVLVWRIMRSRTVIRSSIYRTWEFALRVWTNKHCSLCGRRVSESAIILSFLQSHCCPINWQVLIVWCGSGSSLRPYDFL